MANTKLAPEQRRVHRIKVSLNDAELAEVQAANSTRRSAQWVRDCILLSARSGELVPEPTNKNPDAELLREIAAIRLCVIGMARNANQLARRANQGLKIDILQSLIVIERDLSEIKKSLAGLGDD